MSLKRSAYTAANRALAGLPDSSRRRVLSILSGLPYSRLMPRFMAIEPTNACNLRCPLCPVGRGAMHRAKGFMELEHYSTLLAEISTHARSVLMNFAGEPLLHPHIGTMVEQAVRYGIHLTIGTHGNIDKMEELVAAGLPELLFSLDGTTEEVYGTYRVGGSLDSALGNLEKLVVAREKSGHGLPRIVLQFVVMKHNEHQIPELLALGHRFKVDLISLQQVCINDFFPEDQTELRARWLPIQPQYLLHPEAAGVRPIGRPLLCVWALQSVVLFNGDVTACCFDADGEYVVGNAFGPGGFRSVWRSPAYRELRSRIVRQDLSLCRRCDIGLTKPIRFVPGDSPLAK